MDIIEATTDYETWLGHHCRLHAADLAYKHGEMADRHDPFPFFRGTYYRWVQLWQEICPELSASPRVLAIGDLHVENFGTWRDADGRLCWGINDFDEVDDLPYTIDLVRLAASARCARKSSVLDIKFRDGCSAILDGYHKALAAGGDPFVLEERNTELRALATAADREPVHFWSKLTRLLADLAVEPPVEARAALVRDLPSKALVPAFRFRPKVGMGSLGKPRYVALAEWSGGWVCREAKTITPPSTSWVSRTTTVGSKMASAVKRAVRSPDPYYRPDGGWIARRLAPRCSRIELDHLAKADAGLLLAAMGAETANIHVATPGAAGAILIDLKERPENWLAKAAKKMADAIEQDWKAWRRVQ